MNLAEFQSLYTRIPQSRTEHEEAPRLRDELVQRVGQLEESDENREAITQYIKSKAQGEDAEAVEHLGILLTADDEAFWSLTDSTHIPSRLNALQVLIRRGRGEKARSLVIEMIPYALGRYPKANVYSMIETLSLLGGEAGVEGLWEMTRVACMTAQSMAFQRIIKLSTPHRDLGDGDLDNLERWACLPLDVFKAEVKRAMNDGDLGWLGGLPVSDPCPEELRTYLRYLGERPLELETLLSLPKEWKIEILFRCVMLMSYAFDPTEQWGGGWDTPWPTQGVEILCAIDPPWAQAALEELLSLAQADLNHEIETEIREAIQSLEQS